LLEKRKGGNFMKRILKMILTGVLLFCTVFSIVGCFREKSEEEIARDYITRCAKIEVPTDSEIVYSISEESKGFVQGNTFQYTVFEFENEPTDWLNRNSFEEDKYGGEKFEMAFSGAVTFLPNEIEEIPQEFLPNFKEESYYYLRLEDVYFVYLPQKLWLIAIIPMG